MRLPWKGIHRGFAYTDQPQDTTSDALNATSFNVDGRLRVGQRPWGVTKFHGTQINGTAAIQTITRQAEQISVADGAQTESIWSVDPDIGEARSCLWSRKANLVVATSNASSGDNLAGLLKSDGSESWAADYGDPGRSIGTHKLAELHDQNMALVVDGFLYVFDPVDGSQIVSTAINCDGSISDIGANANGRICVVGDTDSTETVSIWDYDADAQTLTVVDEFTVDDISGISQGPAVWSCWMSDGDDDTIYIGTTRTSSGTIGSLWKITISTRTLVWSQDPFSASCLSVTGDGQGGIFICGSNGTGNTLVRYDDSGASSSSTWSDKPYSTGSTNLQRVKLFQGGLWVIGGYNSTDQVNLFNYSIVGGSKLASYDIGSANSLQGEDLTFDPDNGDIYACGNPTGGNSLYRINPGNVGVSLRDIRLIISSAGTVKVLENGTLTTPTGTPSPSLSSVSFSLQAALRYNKVYFCDGNTYVVVDVSSATPASWTIANQTASAGSLPDVGGIKARLTAVWGKTLIYAIQNQIFMSDSIDPDDFDDTVDEATAAFKITLADQEGLTDVITALIPINNDTMLIGTDHTRWVLAGDPRLGNRPHHISGSVGIYWGQAFAYGPSKEIYFLGTDGVVYRGDYSRDGVAEIPLTKGRIDNDFLVDKAATRVFMQWDIKRHGLHVFLTRMDPVSTDHWFWDSKIGENSEDPRNGWWRIRYPAHIGPTAVATLDGDSTADREILLGGRDGYIYKLDETVQNDDGCAIDSYVDLTPLKLSGDSHTTTLKRIRVTKGRTTDDLNVKARVGKDTEAAVEAVTNAYSVTLSGSGLNEVVRERATGNSIIVQMGNDTKSQGWDIESVSAEVQTFVAPVRA